MAATKRSQNKCKKCGYTWHPRGKNMSLKCPSCGSSEVGCASTPIPVPANPTSELPQDGHFSDMFLPLGCQVYPHFLHLFCERFVAAIFFYYLEGYSQRESEQW